MVRPSGQQIMYNDCHFNRDLGYNSEADYSASYQHLLSAEVTVSLRHAAQTSAP
jgi:hypothetical protein